MNGDNMNALIGRSIGLIQFPFSSDDDHGATRSQNSPQRKQRVIADIVQDQVITLAALGEIFLRVINDVIRPDGADQVQVSRAAYTGDLRAE